MEGREYGLTKKVGVRGSEKQGRGLFAVAPIAAGEVVWRADPHAQPACDKWVRMSAADVMRMPEDARREAIHYGYQVSATEMETPLTGERAASCQGWFYNHSCDPNTWYGDERIDEALWDTVWTARRDIAVGEELTYDYATSETIFLKFKVCACGSPLCRSTLSVSDWSLPILAARYGRHFSRHAMHMIDSSAHSRPPE